MNQAGISIRRYYHKKESLEGLDEFKVFLLAIKETGDPKDTQISVLHDNVVERRAYSMWQLDTEIQGTSLYI